MRAGWPCAALVLGELCRDSRAAAASAYCCSSLIISGLSGDMGRVSSSALGSCGDEALCLPLLVDSSDELWEPGDKEMEQVRKTTLEKNLRAKQQQWKGTWGYHGMIVGSALNTGMMEGSQGTPPQTLG